MHIYRPRSEAGEGYVFTGVCYSVTFGGGGVTSNASWDKSHDHGGGGVAGGGGRWRGQGGWTSPPG